VLAADAAPPGVRDAINRLIDYEVNGEGNVRDESFLAFFTPRFRAAIEQDTAGSDIQTLDTDFICQCQTAVVKMHVLTISGSKDAASAGIESWSKGNPPVKLRLHLEFFDDSWLVSDVETARTPSLLIKMEQANKPS
jgi:hypothetical protein